MSKIYLIHSRKFPKKTQRTKIHFFIQGKNSDMWIIWTLFVAHFFISSFFFLYTLPVFAPFLSWFQAILRQPVAQSVMMDQWWPKYGPRWKSECITLNSTYNIIINQSHSTNSAYLDKKVDKCRESFTTFCSSLKLIYSTPVPSNFYIAGDVFSLLIPTTAHTVAAEGCST